MPSETIEASAFSTKISAIVVERQLENAGQMQGAVAGRHDLRRHHRQQADHRAAHHRPQRRPHPQAREQHLAGGDPAHQRDAEDSRQQADAAGDHHVMHGEAGYRAGFDAEPVGRKDLRGQIAEQGRHADRRERGDRIAADDQLEAVKGAAQRRAEGAGNGRGGAAADQDAHVAAAQAKGLSDLGGNAAGKLGIASLQADRGADPARPHRLRRHDQAAAQGHAPAVQGVGLDRVDLGAAPARDVGGHKAEQQPAEAGREKRVKRVERTAARQPFAGVETEKGQVHERDRFAHGGDRQTGHGADDERQHDHARFTSAHNGAQAMRNFEWSAEPAHGE